MKKSFSIILALGAFVYGVPLKEIKFEGLVHISPTVAAEMVGIKLGDEIDIKKVDDSIKRFYEQGYFEDINVFEDGGVLIYRFKEKPIIANIELNGYGEGKEKEDLQKEITLKKGDIYDVQKVERAKRKIVQAIEKEGYFDTVVEDTTEIIRDGSLNLILDVNKGEKIIIKEVNYCGAKELGRSDFESVTANKERELMGWMWGLNDGKLKLNDLEYDAPRIKDLYRQKGFLDAEVSDALLEADFNTYTAKLTYNITEGNIYRVSKVNVNITEPVVNIEKIKGELKVFEGRKFNIQKVRRDVERIKEIVGDEGYAFARIVPDFDKNSTDGTVAITYNIEPGKKVYINDVIISGNTHTLDRVVRRDIFLGPGDLYSYTDLKDSKNALKRAGYFEDVTIEERRISAERVDLIVKVKEALTGEFRFGAGYGSYGGLSGTLGVTDKNLLGSGMSATISVDASSKESLYRLSLQNPRLYDSPYSAGWDLYRSEYEAYDYTEKRTGGSMNFGRKLMRHLRANLGYEYTITSFSDTTANFNAKYYPSGEFVKSSITPGLTYNNTDDYLLPRSGINASTYLEYAGVGGDGKFLKNGYTFAYYYGLEDLLDYDLIMRYKARAGMLFDNGYLPINEKFYLGGLNSIRGFKSSSVSPKDEEGIRIGGKKMFANSLEASIPLVEGAKLRTTFFYDYGMIGEDDFSSITRSSYGAAIEWISPIGPIYLVFPQPIDSKNGDKTSSFEFTMGRSF